MNRLSFATILVSVGLLSACGESKPVPPDAAAAPAVETPAAPPPPPELATKLADDKPVLAISGDPTLEGEFMKDGYHLSALKNAGLAWGSYGPSGDSALGHAIIKFDVSPGAKHVGIPVTNGPAHAGTKLEVRDDNGKVIASLTPSDDYLKWSLWDVTLPANAKQITIESSDTSSEWGEWIAFGQPRVTE